MDRLPLVDGDILLYELGSAAEWPKDEPIKSFSFIVELLDKKLWEIKDRVGTSLDPVIFTTKGGNYRHELATLRPYKGSRRDVVKPFHYKNLLTYFSNRFDHRHVWGLEADDAMGIWQWNAMKETGNFDSTIICSRDKDLKMIPGWHFSWECGKQAEFGPRLTDEMGWIQLSKDKKKITGMGLKFFWSQMLTGDKTDDIPGVPGIGPVTAMEILNDLEDKEALYQAVLKAYSIAFEDVELGYQMFLEQARLLWICREFDDVKGGIERWLV